jgi:hypothetical protein
MDASARHGSLSPRRRPKPASGTPGLSSIASAPVPSPPSGALTAATATAAAASASAPSGAPAVEDLLLTLHLEAGAAQLWYLDLRRLRALYEDPYARTAAYPIKQLQCLRLVTAWRLPMPMPPIATPVDDEWRHDSSADTDDVMAALPQLAFSAPPPLPARMAHLARFSCLPDVVTYAYNGVLPANEGILSLSDHVPRWSLRNHVIGQPFTFDPARPHLASLANALHPSAGLLDSLRFLLHARIQPLDQDADDAPAANTAAHRRNSTLTPSLPAGHICFFNLRLGALGCVLSLPYAVRGYRLSDAGLLVVETACRRRLVLQLDLAAVHRACCSNMHGVFQLCHRALQAELADTFQTSPRSPAAARSAAGSAEGLHTSLHADYMASLRKADPPAVQVGSPVVRFMEEQGGGDGALVNAYGQEQGAYLSVDEGLAQLISYAG